MDTEQMTGKDLSKSEQFKMPKQMSVGPPTLMIKDADRMLDFYAGKLKLKVNSSDDNVELRCNQKFTEISDPLLILKNDSSVRDAPHSSAGLYHFAILVPDRKSLALAYSLLTKNGVQFEGFADHLVSESLYLHDPEGNGIEIYRDRPRSEWTFHNDGRVAMDVLPLNLDDLTSELSQEELQITEVFHSGAGIGHMHLRVTDLLRSVKFYHEKLGLDISSDSSLMGAMFLSAGGYHHHIGLNTWQSQGGEPHQAGLAGLDRFTIKLPYNEVLFHQLELRLENSVTPPENERELLAIDPDGIQLTIKGS